MIGDIVNYQTFNTFYTNEVRRNPLFEKEAFVKVKEEAGDLYEVGGEKHIVGFNVFDNHDVYALIPQNTESGEPEIKNIGEKF